MTCLQEFDKSVYQAHGFSNRDEYIASLSEEYGAELVDALTSIMPPSEDFDGLISELEDNFGLELWTPLPPCQGALTVVFFKTAWMATTYDFTIVSNRFINGLSLVMPMNEQALDYITDELHLTTLTDGSAPLFNEVVGDFISDAESAQLSCEYV